MKCKVRKLNLKFGNTVNLVNNDNAIYVINNCTKTPIFLIYDSFTEDY